MAYWPRELAVFTASKAAFEVAPSQPIRDVLVRQAELAGCGWREIEDLLLTYQSGLSRATNQFSVRYPLAQFGTQEIIDALDAAIGFVSG